MEQGGRAYLTPMPVVQMSSCDQLYKNWPTAATLPLPWAALKNSSVENQGHHVWHMGQWLFLFSFSKIHSNVILEYACSIIIMLFSFSIIMHFDHFLWDKKKNPKRLWNSLKIIFNYFLKINLKVLNYWNILTFQRESLVNPEIVSFLYYYINNINYIILFIIYHKYIFSIKHKMG